MGGSSLQFLLTLILLFLLCMKPTTGNNLGLADTHLGCKEHERQALLKIKQDLIDDYGRLSSWSSDQDCCTWSGVRCSNQTGHVIMLNLNGLNYFPSPPLRGKEREYKNILGLLKSIDLSSNNLTGQIPREIVELVGLVSLNLSRNHLIGQITSEIDMLQSLDALDLSKNQLSGGIPSSLSHIDRLSVLDLSKNNLSGKIPTSPHLDTFNASSYEGNSNLCGAPLPKKCLGEEIAQVAAMNRSREHAGLQDEKKEFISIGFYVSVALGFIAGFWGVVGTLVLNMSLRATYFRFLNNFKDRLYVAISANMARVQRQLQN